ncbi:MAG: peptidoglycan-binding protein LysM [Xanthobacteraceae bacterium]
MDQCKKMRAVFVTALTAIVIAACLVTTTQAQPSGEHVRGRAYLFYGLIPAIDWGMDELAQRINRSGIAAGNYSHASWRSVADQAISDYRRDPNPIAVVGHSIGGDSAVQFAQALGAARVPVSLLITYDATRAADGSVPANVHRYINLYQSSNILGGGDLAPGSGFHGHYASYNLKDRSEIIHVNLDKFSRIQELLAAKVRSMGAGGEGEAVPIRIVFAATGPIELWDDGMALSAHAGDTLHSLAGVYHVPVWALAQLNRKPEGAALGEGERVVVPRYLGQRIASRSPDAAKPPSDEEPKPEAGESKNQPVNEALP